MTELSYGHTVVYSPIIGTIRLNPMTCWVTMMGAKTTGKNIFPGRKAIALNPNLFFTPSVCLSMFFGQLGRCLILIYTFFVYL